MLTTNLFLVNLTDFPGLVGIIIYILLSLKRSFQSYIQKFVKSVVFKNVWFTYMMQIYIFSAWFSDQLIKGCWKIRMSNSQGNGGVNNKLNEIWFPDAYFMTSGYFTLSHIAIKAGSFLVIVGN